MKRERKIMEGVKEREWVGIVSKKKKILKIQKLIKLGVAKPTYEYKRIHTKEENDGRERERERGYQPYWH